MKGARSSALQVCQRLGERTFRIFILSRISCRIKLDHPFRIAFGRHDDIRVADGISAGFNPACTVAPLAGSPFASEADEIDFGVPLPMPLANRAECVESAVSRLEWDDVEGVWAIGACTRDDVTGVGNGGTPAGRVNWSSLKRYGD